MVFQNLQNTLHYLINIIYFFVMCQLKYLYLLFIVVILLNGVSCADSENKIQGVILATPENLPPGTLGKPGPDTGIYLGDYKTCKAYADAFVKKYWMLRPIIFFGSLLNPDEPVHCRVAHTCNCLNNIYFVEGSSDPLYRCVEPPSAQVESEDIYTNKTGELIGAIKFAKPGSLCPAE